MLLLFFISIFATCRGNLLCMLLKYGECAMNATNTAPTATSYCVDANTKYACWVKESKKCRVEDSKVVKKLLSDYNEVCMDKWDNAFKEREACVYDLYQSSKVLGSGPCDYVLEEKDQDQTMEPLCRSLDRTFDCLRSNVLQRCGREADYVFCKLLGSRQKLVDEACYEAGIVNNATHEDSWCVVSSATAMAAMYRVLNVFVAVLSAKLLNM